MDMAIISPLMIGIGGLFLLWAIAKGELFALLVSIFCIVFGSLFIWVTLSTMPLRIYKGGFTETSVNLFLGLLRKERVVPIECLNKVSLVKGEQGGIDVYTVQIDYMTDIGDEGTIYLDHDDIDDPMAMLLALKAARPEAMDETTDMFVGPGAAEEVYTVEDCHWRRQKRGGLGMGSLIFMAIAVHTAYVVNPGFRLFMTLEDAFIIGMISFAIVFLVGVSAYAHRNDYKEVFETSARVENGYLVAVAPIVDRIFANCRQRVPLNEIRVAHKCLDKVSFFHKTRIDMVSGETLELPYQVFDVLESEERFERRGFDLVNVGDVANKGKLVSSYGWMKIILALVILYFIPL
jgi:hypothetical protein